MWCEPTGSREGATPAHVRARLRNLHRGHEKWTPPVTTRCLAVADCHRLDRLDVCTLSRAPRQWFVPSPATSEVLEATSLTIWAPMFSNLSSIFISLATVTREGYLLPDFYSGGPEYAAASLRDFSLICSHGRPTFRGLGQFSVI